MTSDDLAIREIRTRNTTRLGLSESAVANSPCVWAEPECRARIEFVEADGLGDLRRRKGVVYFETHGYVVDWAE